MLNNMHTHDEQLDNKSWDSNGIGLDNENDGRDKRITF